MNASDVKTARRQARERAVLARDQAVVAAEQARSWAVPRIEEQLDRGLKVAAPKVEAAAASLGPAVDAARDRIVDDLLPRLVEVVNAAAAAGIAAREAAAEQVSARVEDVARAVADATPTAKARRSRSRRGRILLMSVIGAALGAGVAAWLRSRRPDASWDSHPTAVPVSEHGADGVTGLARDGEPGPLSHPLPDGHDTSSSPGASQN